MKNIYSLFFAAIGSAAMAQPMIGGFVDGPCTGGTPKVLEILTVGTVDFTQYSLQNQTNANTNWGATFSLAELGTRTGAVYLVNGTQDASSAAFAAEFPDVDPANVFYITGSTINVNGDDRLRIISGTAEAPVVIDAFGVDGVDGSDTEWDYLDGYFYRKSTVTAPNPTFDIEEWNFSGINFTDGKGTCNEAAPLATELPFGSHPLSVSSNYNNIEGLSVYPNPVSGGNLYITSAANEVKDVKIYNIIGKEVAAARVENGSMNIAQLTAGVYIVKITEAGKTATRKLVVN